MTKNEDRISNLPDGIINNIFYFLGDMTDMTEIIRTSILSKRWRYLWTSAPNLVFDFLEDDDELESSKYCYDSDDDSDEEDGVGRLEKFFNFISRVLSPSYTSNINKLSIQCYASVGYQMTKKINEFIIAAEKRNVQEIHLHCNFADGGQLSDRLFTSQLRVFKFANYSKAFKNYGEDGMYMPRSISAGAANIRMLELKSIVLPTTNSGEVIISCPVLEDLKIKNCHIYGARIFTVSAPLLNKLKLEKIYCQKIYMEREKNYCINIRSTNLKHLDLSDYEFSGNFTLENHSNLTSANINLCFEDCKEQSPKCLMKVLAEISNVRSLAVPYHLVEVIANSPNMLELLAHKFQNLRHLIMFEDFTGYFSYNPVATVLQTFPRRVNPILNTRDVPVDPSSKESLKKLLEQKDVSSSKNCLRVV